MRDERIDIVRFIGLAMIVLAHVAPPGFIFQARNFDVPLMVIVSGLSFRASYKNECYYKYLLNRFARLVFPVWLFLTVYFIISVVTGYPSMHISGKLVAESYLLSGGIGYVWIIRVFLLVACVSPLIISCSRNTKSNRRYFSVVLFCYVSYEFFLYQFRLYINSLLGVYLEQIILYLVPYAIVFSLGVRIPDLRKNQLLFVALFSFVTFLLFALFLFFASGKIIQTQDYKYPPGVYYLSYAIFVSIIVWVYSDLLLRVSNWANMRAPILFISQNSIWVYLWHIPLVEAVNLPFYFKYLVVFFGASFLAAAQVYVVKKYLLGNISNTKLKRSLRSLLTG